MSEFSNESGAMPNGFSATSMEELNQVEGGFLPLLIVGVGFLAGFAGTKEALEGTGKLKSITQIRNEM